jgi:uncharacterized damage-inducible protein DinB
MSDLVSMLAEFNAEAATTKRVLDRVPADKLGWKPHARSMSLGQLALHIATVPAGICRITEADAFDVSQNSFLPPSPKTMDEVHTALDDSIRKVEKTLTECSESHAQASWHLLMGDKELMSTPRVQVWRSLMLNHWYHHRGQLAVYLRLLEVPVPSIYGPSGDENPFS